MFLKEMFSCSEFDDSEDDVTDVESEFENI